MACKTQTRVRFLSKRGKCERKSFRLEQKNDFFQAQQAHLGFATHFRFRSKRVKCEQKSFRLEQKKIFSSAIGAPIGFDTHFCFRSKRENNRFAQNRKKFQTKPAHPTTDPSYMFPGARSKILRTEEPQIFLNIEISFLDDSKLSKLDENNYLKPVQNLPNGAFSRI